MDNDIHDIRQRLERFEKILNDSIKLFEIRCPDDDLIMTPVLVKQNNGYKLCYRDNLNHTICPECWMTAQTIQPNTSIISSESIQRSASFRKWILQIVVIAVIILWAGLHNTKKSIHLNFILNFTDHILKFFTLGNPKRY